MPRHPHPARRPQRHRLRLTRRRQKRRCFPLLIICQRFCLCCRPLDPGQLRLQEGVRMAVDVASLATGYTNTAPCRCSFSPPTAIASPKTALLHHPPWVRTSPYPRCLASRRSYTSPPRTLGLRAAVGLPPDPARRFVRAHHPIPDLIQPGGGPMQLMSRRQYQRHRRNAVVGERDRPVISMSARQLVRNLPQQRYQPRDISQHPKFVSRILEGVSPVCQPAEPLIGLCSISNRTNKRRHPNMFL